MGEGVVGGWGVGMGGGVCNVHVCVRGGVICDKLLMMIYVLHSETNLNEYCKVQFNNGTM